MVRSITIVIPSGLDRGLVVLDQRVQRRRRNSVHTTPTRCLDGEQVARTNPIPHGRGGDLEPIGHLGGRQHWGDV